MKLSLLFFPTLVLLAGCAGAREDTSGITFIRRTPDEFCRGTARSIAIDRYEMKRGGTTLARALEPNGGVAVVDAITRAVYSRDPRSDREAADIGTAACLEHFR